jgi:hypothetical protein
MAEGNQPPIPQGYQVESTVVTPLPAQRAFPLRRADFLTLCDENNGSERASRDLHGGFFISAVIGLTGLISSIDWSKPFTSEKVSYTSFLLLLVIAAATGWGCLYHWRRIKRENTPYTRLRQFISEFFDE